MALSLLLNAFCISPAAAAVDMGGSRSPFELGGSARNLGMGGAAVAVTGEGESFFENPAALATLLDKEILTFHAPLYIDTLYDSIGYVHPIGARNSFGLSFARLATDNVLRTQTNIQALSTFTSEQWQAQAGYGFQLLDGLDLGATVKYYRQQFDSYSGSGMGVDLGVLYRFSRDRKDYSHIGLRNFALGLGVSNVLQPQVRLFQTADQPARVYRPGLSYLFQPSSSSSIWLAFEGEVMEAGDPVLKAGLEYGWNETVFARAGFDGVSPTAGGGLRIAGFQLDYAFNQRDLGALHRFSLSYRFGRYVDPKQAQRIDLLKWVAKSYSKTEDYDPAIQAWKNVLNEFPGDGEAANAIQDLQKRRRNAVADKIKMAKAAMSRGDYNRALPLIAKVMSLDPGNPEAKALLKQVDQRAMVSANYVQGMEAYSKEDYESAVQYLQAVYELDPHYRNVNFLYHDAQSHYLPLQSMPKEMTELYAKGVDHYMSGRYRKAVEAWEQVLEKNPKNYLVQRNLEEARARIREGTLDKSIPENSTPKEKK